jgi:hypothetical protein
MEKGGQTMFRRIAGVIGAWLLVWAVIRAAPLPAGTAAPEAFLDARCAVYVRYDGWEKHRETWEKTAFAEVLRNGLQPAMQKIGDQILQSLQSLPETSEILQQLQKHLPPVLEHLNAHGLVFGLQLVEPQDGRVQLTLVLPEQAKQEPHLAALIRMVAESNNWKITAVQLRERKIQQVQIADSSWKISWWSEANHLLLLIGTESPELTLDVAEGKKPSLLQSEWFKRVSLPPGYASCLRGYVNGQPLLEALRQLGPGWRKVIEVTGLEDIPAISFHVGAQDRALRSTLTVHLKPGSRKGLAALFPTVEQGIEPYLRGQKALPPLSPRGDVTVQRFDLAQGISQLRSIIQTVADVIDEQESGKSVRDFFDKAGQMPELEWLRELLPHLDSLWVYTDASADGLLSTGILLGVHLQNVAGARKALAKIKSFQNNGLALQVHRSKYRGVELICLKVQSATGFGLPLIPTLGIVDDWLFVALYPQPIQGVIARRELAQLSRWKPSPEAEKVLASLPSGKARLVGFSESDPRGTVEFLMSVMPMVGGLISAFSGGDFDVTVIPPAQLITEPLFPNVTLYLAEPDAFRIESYDSLPLNSFFALNWNGGLILLSLWLQFSGLAGN